MAGPSFNRQPQENARASDSIQADEKLKSNALDRLQVARHWRAFC